MAAQVATKSILAITLTTFALMAWHARLDVAKTVLKGFR